MAWGNIQTISRTSRMAEFSSFQLQLGLAPITKTLLFKYIHHQKMKVYIIFSYFCSKHRLWVLVRKGGSNEYPQCMFWEQKYKKISEFLYDIFHFVVVKFAFYEINLKVEKTFIKTYETAHILKWLAITIIHCLECARTCQSRPSKIWFFFFFFFFFNLANLLQY